MVSGCNVTAFMHFAFTSVFYSLGWLLHTWQVMNTELLVFTCVEDAATDVDHIGTLR